MKTGIAIMILILFLGCGEPKENCIQIITPAISPDGECTEFPTPCDVPTGYTLTESCNETIINECSATCNNECRGNDYYKAQCIGGNCEYTIERSSPICVQEPEQEKKDYSLDVNLRFCDYDKGLKKYTFFYQIKNQGNNAPPLKTQVILQMPELGVSQTKIIQDEYGKNRLFWEKREYTFMGTIYRGQNWDIRNQPYFTDTRYQLIMCEPGINECNEKTGIILDAGFTGDVCD